MNYEPEVVNFNYTRSGIRRVLGNLEADIMELVWERRLPEGVGVRVKEIHKVLFFRSELAYTTVMTTMARMARKGLLRAERDGAGYIYYPTAADSKEFHHQIMKLTVACLLQDDGFLANLDEADQTVLAKIAHG